ncbi:MAG TPA: cytochrome C oxidase subunit IV family protein [Mariniphaga sp.]|nr:cytochrome C oxidase subunit IV family protein [Mariniphaga sp.]
MSLEKNHVVPYKTYVFVLLGLITLTLLSIAITEIELGSLAVAAALAFAIIKSFLVLTWFMHLKYDKPYIILMVVFVFAVLFVTVLVTFFDYLYR